MKQIQTTQPTDVTKHLSCATCPLHYNCNKYALICDFIHNKLYIGAKLLCVLMQSENATTNVLSECNKNALSNPNQRAATLYELFLPTLNKYLNAFYKHERENASDYHKQTLIFTLAESLNRWGLLQYFDFIFSQNIENTYNILQKQFEYEITKSEHKN